MSTSLREALMGLVLLYESETALMAILDRKGRVLFGAPKRRRR